MTKKVTHKKKRPMFDSGLVQKMGPGSPDSLTIRFEGPMNDNIMETALYTRTASPSLACTLTSINNNNNSSLFSQVFPQCDSQHNSLSTSRCSKGKKEDKNGGGAVAIAAGN